MATLDHQISVALKLLSQYDAVNKGEFSTEGIGDKTIKCLLDEGFASEFESPSGQKRYSITASGLDRHNRPSVTAKVKRKPLKMLPNRIKTLDTWKK